MQDQDDRAPSGPDLGSVAGDAGFAEAYTRFSSHPWQAGTPTPEEREFIYIAIDRATTHLFDPGLRVHIRNAMSYGATTAEMLEVMELTSLMGIQSDGVGGRILAEEADKQEMLEGERQ